MPIQALEDPRARGVFKAWRDGMAATPRKADYAWVTLAKVLAFAKDRGRIAANVCERGGRLYESTRVDKIWTEEHLAALLAEAPTAIRQIVTMALWTGQRQGDLLALAWRNVDDRYVTLRQSKTGRLVTIPIGTELRRVLDEQTAARPRQAGPPPADSQTILVNSRGLYWTSDGFRTSWAAAVAKAGLGSLDLHFHDLRGTEVTRLGVAGCTEAEIATITGLSLDTVRSILDRHYLNRDFRLAESAIRKLEKNEKRTAKENGKRTKVANRAECSHLKTG